MSTTNRSHLFAMIDIPIKQPFARLAAHLTSLLPGFSFEEDCSNRYEEVPAFIASCGEMSFALLGIPAGSTGHGYQLEFDLVMEQTVASLIDKNRMNALSLFVRKEKVPNSRGFLDYSQELADYLTSRGIEGCKPIIVGD